jgi:hypothetical protein
MVVEQVVNVWIGPKLIKMCYRTHTNGGVTLIPVEGEPIVATREIKPAPQAEGLRRRGHVEQWNFPEKRRKA